MGTKKEVSTIKIGEVYLEPEDWGSCTDADSDWSLAHEAACFVHKDACEFIFHLSEPALESYRRSGFSETFIKLFERAHEEGLKYVLLYS